MLVPSTYSTPCQTSVCRLHRCQPSNYPIQFLAAFICLHAATNIHNITTYSDTSPQPATSPKHGSNQVKRPSPPPYFPPLRQRTRWRPPRHRPRKRPWYCPPPQPDRTSQIFRYRLPDRSNAVPMLLLRPLLHTDASSAFSLASLISLASSAKQALSSSHSDLNVKPAQTSGPPSRAARGHLIANGASLANGSLVGPGNFGAITDETPCLDLQKVFKDEEE